MDEPIGENVYKFLMDYQNWDVVKFAVAKMILISEISKIRTGVDPMDAFFDEMGIKTKTMYRDGDYMIDSETWERYEIKKSEKPLKKLFSVMD